MQRANFQSKYSFQRQALVFITVVAVSVWFSGCSRTKSHSVQLSNQGMRAYGKGNKSSAKKHFQEALSFDGENYNAHYGLGLIYIDRGKPDQARRHLLKTRGLKPDHVEASYQLGWIALKAGRKDEAAASFQQVFTLNPDHADSNFQMGRIQEERGDLDAANVSYRRAVQLLPYRPDIYLALAQLYMKVQAIEEALVVLREGVRLCTVVRVRNRRNLSLLFNELGGILLEGGQYPEAVEVLLQSVRLDAPIDVAFNLACAHAANGDVEDAITYFNQFLSGDSADSNRITVARKVVRHLRSRLRQRERDSQSEIEG
jgi:tetratricopeptide (TPR) repeat protein